MRAIEEAYSPGEEMKISKAYMEAIGEGIVSQTELEGLIFHAPMNDMVGTTLSDQSASALQVTSNDAMLVDDTTFGKCLDFNGTASYLDVPFLSTLANLATQSCTVAFWMNADALGGWKRLLTLNCAYDYFMHVCTRSTSQVNVVVNVLQDETFRFHELITPTGGLKSGQWYHIAATWQTVEGQDSVLRLYVDGQDVGEAVSPLTVHSGGSAQSLRIGSRVNGSRYFDGRLAHMRIYDRSLSAEEVQTVMSDQEPRVNRFRQMQATIAAIKAEHADQKEAVRQCIYALEHPDAEVGTD